MNTSECSACGASGVVLLVHGQRICGRLVAWVECRACFAAAEKRDAELKAEREAKALPAPARKRAS